VRAASAQARFTLVLMQGVGGLAVFLAAVGLYSVIRVRRDTADTGVRHPPRAWRDTRGLGWWVVRRAMMRVAISAAAGVVAALLAVRAVCHCCTR
jgi:hypothetical protein